MLRAMLMNDFGKDILISGGFGNNATDPIILSAQSPHDASWSEMEVAKCIYGQLGWHWKMLDRAKVDGPQGALERLSCEVRYVEEEQFVTETRSFYFDVSQISLDDEAQTTPICGVNLGADTGMGLPYQLGWFHFDSLIDNEVDHPGLGASVAYSAPNTKATLYVYNKGDAEIDGVAQPEKLEKEFQLACRDFLTLNPSAEAIAENFSSNLMFRSFGVGSAYSVVTLSTAGNHFFKLRATLDRSNVKYKFDCFLESVNLILSLAHSEK